MEEDMDKLAGLFRKYTILKYKLEGERDERVKYIDEKISKLKEKRSEIVKPFNDELKDVKEEFDIVKDKLIEFYDGTSHVTTPSGHTLEFREYPKVVVEDEDGLLELIAKHGWSDLVKGYYKRKLRKLLDDGFLEEGVVKRDKTISVVLEW